MKREHYADAAAAFTRMLMLPAARKSNVISSEIYTERAYMEALQGAYRASRADLERAIALDKTNLRAHNNYSWLLATCPDGSVRDGQRALAFARALNQKQNSNDASVLDTLAAAQAETGDFRGAIKTQQRALSAGRSNNRALYEQHLNSFEKGEPLRLPPDRPRIEISTKL
jgi:Tfp pilus assembly protein PilF